MQSPAEHAGLFYFSSFTNMTKKEKRNDSSQSAKRYWSNNPLTGSVCPGSSLRFAICFENKINYWPEFTHT